MAAVPRPHVPEGRSVPGHSRKAPFSASSRRARTEGTRRWHRGLGMESRGTELGGRRVENNGSGIRSAAFGGLRGFSTRLRCFGRWQRQQKGSVLLPLPLRL